MVYLSRIYTKTGDSGETTLGDGSRVAKDHPRVCAYGSVDELGAIVGLLVSQHGNVEEPEGAAEFLRDIQNDLFDVGADLCVPDPGEENRLRVRREQSVRLEKALDGWNEKLEPLRSFVLAGGAIQAAWCHLARTVCRRAEREVVTLARSERVNPEIVIYLNRLSDLFFVLGRAYNRKGNQDVLWVPGKNMGPGSDAPRMS